MKQAIVFCSFGVSDARAREACLDASAALIRQHYPIFLVCQAYTSAFIQKRLRGQGIWWIPCQRHWNGCCSRDVNG